jgi:cation diffusion facilitator family transporter
LNQPCVLPEHEAGLIDPFSEVGTEAVSVHELYRKSRRVAFWGIVVSLCLGLVKLLGGWFGHSFALVSDAVHSLGDALASSAILGALVLSQRPPDRSHPYGYTRAETAAGSTAALLLILSAVWIVRQALISLAEPYETPAAYTLLIALVSAVLKEGLYRYNSRVARKAGSSALLASAWDHRLDAFSSVAVLVGVALAKWGGWRWADQAGALVVAATILGVGISLFWHNFHELMDQQADPLLVNQVRSEAGAVPGVRGIEKLLIRKTGLEYLVDMHVEVDPNMSVRDGHTIAHAVKDRVMGRVELIKDVLIHIEPAPNHRG